MENRCPICHISIDKGSYCPSCGLPRSNRPEHHSVKEYQLCPKCDTPNPYRAKYCRNCGMDIRTQAKDINGHGWVDLGLSVLWSAETMEGFYPWRDSSTMLTQYSERLDLDFKGDGKDVANVKWGEKWRIPTMEEFGELINKCKWEKVVLTQSDEHALKVTGPNGNHILLKTTGWAGCRNNDQYHLGFHESEYSYCSFWTSSELISREDFPPAGCKFTYSGYRDFKPTLTFKQEHGELTGGFAPNRVRSFFFLQGIEDLKELVTRIEDLKELVTRIEDLKELEKNLNTSDFEERKKNEKIDMQRRHALWLEIPCKLETVKRLEEKGIILPPNMLPSPKYGGGSIRPVADKKWKGKM